jgi:hypothetical protein
MDFFLRRRENMSIYAFNRDKRVKLFLCLTSYVLCHEDMGEWRYSSSILDLGIRWK